MVGYVKCVIGLSIPGGKMVIGADVDINYSYELHSLLN